MTGVSVALLLMLAVGMLRARGGVDRRARPAGRGRPALAGGLQKSLPGPSAGYRRRDRHAPAGAASRHELPMVAHQLAGLLRAGRPPHLLWTDLERIYAEEDTEFAVTAGPVFSTARRASDLGLSVPEALRDATGASDGASGGGSAGRRTDRLWVDLAGCLTVAETSGAPLATILDHYAAQLEAEIDAHSARETALAGPRTTVVLLAWLPAGGLVLGFALGIDPVGILLGSPPGRVTLALGVLLMVVSRSWSRRLVRRAGSAP